MRYHELLSKYIEDSGLSLGEIVLRAKHLGVNITKSYISKLKNGNKPPASEEVTRVLAKVTKGNEETLIQAAYYEKAPEELKKELKKLFYLDALAFEVLKTKKQYGDFISIEGDKEFTKLKEYSDLSLLITMIANLLLDFRKTTQFNLQCYENVKAFISKIEPKYDLDLDLDITMLPNHPEKATSIISRLMFEYFPNIKSFESNNAVFEINDNGTIEINYEPISSPDNEQADLQKKMNFFYELENDLGLDLTDPEVQKKLKRAAKIIFSDED
ncbi:hypothetical protein [Paenibacillus sp. JJ1722]|uniref:hypothetical protein n=1 Tax=Paenibacillus sp. JJ1722 TaxID=3398770 RepID=UPI003AAF6E57